MERDALALIGAQRKNGLEMGRNVGSEWIDSDGQIKRQCAAAKGVFGSERFVGDCSIGRVLAGMRL